MSNSNKQGKFIVIEGGDGCGKTSVINGLKEHFKNATFVREPGGTPFGEKVRDMIMDCAEISKVTEMYLFSASRSELVEKVVLPGIRQGKLIICDRFVYSSYAYQGVGASIGVENVDIVNSFALRGVKPDLVIYLKVSKGFRTENENRLDEQSEEQRQAIYSAYNMMAEVYDNFYVLNVDGKSQEKVLKEVIQAIEKELKTNKKEQKNER